MFFFTFFQKQQMKVAILPENFQIKSTILQIKHPRTNIPCPFLLQGTKLYELLEVDQPNRSFLFANQVISNGNIMMAAQIHPLFLALPLLIERQSVFYSLEDFFNNTDIKPIEYLIFPYFHLVCKNLTVTGYDVWQLSEEKLFSWLLSKITNLTLYLKSQLHYNQIIKAKNLNDVESDKFYLETAYDILRHYIRATLAKSLRLKLREIYPSCFQPIVVNCIKPSVIEKKSAEETKNFASIRKNSSQNLNQNPIEKKKEASEPKKKKDSGKKKGKEVKIAKNCLENFFLPEKKKS